MPCTAFPHMCVPSVNCREPTLRSSPSLPLCPGVWQGPRRLQGAARLAPAAGQEAGRAVVGSGSSMQ